ncbi:hypothetical protein ACFX1T_004831 [Malus domestica]
MRLILQLMICIHEVKADIQRPGGLMQNLPIPVWKWENITMDFVYGLPRTPLRDDGNWTYSLEKLVKLFVNNVVRLHGVPISIVSDRDPRFTSRFWKAFNAAMGTQLLFSTAYHPQADVSPSGRFRL